MLVSTVLMNLCLHLTYNTSSTYNIIVYDHKADRTEMTSQYIKVAERDRKREKKEYKLNLSRKKELVKFIYKCEDAELPT